MQVRLPLLFLFVVALPAIARADPKVFVVGKTEVIFDLSDRIVGVRNIWTFDKDFSDFAIQGLDANGDGKLNNSELAPLAKVNIESLNEYKYFTSIQMGQEAALFDKPTDYHLTFDGTQLTLTFVLKVASPAAIGRQHMTLTVFDEGDFVWFDYTSPQSVTLSNSPGTCNVASAPGAGDNGLSVEIACGSVRAMPPVETGSGPDDADDLEDASQVAFLMPTFWVVTSPSIVKGDLVFRRYSLVYPNSGLTEALRARKLSLDFDEKSGFPNSFLLLCRSNPEFNDVVVVHLPENMRLQGINRDAWIPDGELRVLADDESFRFQSEYIKGDIFIDFVSGANGKLLTMLNASVVTLEFGEQNARLHFVSIDQLGSGRVADFFRDMMTNGPAEFPKAVKFFATAEVLKACQRYKTTGTF